MRSAGSKARIRRAEPDFATVARAEPMPKRSLANGLADLAKAGQVDEADVGASDGLPAEPGVDVITL